MLVKPLESKSLGQKNGAGFYKKVGRDIFSACLSAGQMAADRIRVGEAEVMIAADVESMSMAPMSGNSPSLSPALFDNDENVGTAYGMAMMAGKVARQWKVSREAQDQFAYELHMKALKA